MRKIEGLTLISLGCAVVIASFRSVLLRFVLRREPSISLQCHKMIRQFFSVVILVALSLATEWLLGSRFCDILGSGQARPRFRS